MAAQNVSGPVNISCNLSEIVTSAFAGTLTAAAVDSLNTTFAYATATAGAIDTLYCKQLTMAAAATHIDLYAFTDPLGNSVSMARVRMYWVHVVTVTQTDLLYIYTRTGTDPVAWLAVATTSFQCEPQGIIFGIDPASTSTNGFVVSSSAYDFTLDPGSNTVVANVIIAGNSGA
jgi:hypothetical protein